MRKDVQGDMPRRGDLRRADKIMSAAEVREFLASVHCGRTATLGADGYPYVVPNLFVWMDERIFLHTARQRGHFLANVEFCDRVCFEADQPGETFPYGPVECDTSIAFRSVVVFGRIGIVSSQETKQRFFTAFMTKYAPQDSWGRSKDSFPRIDSTILYSILPEIMTGKQTPLPTAEKRWRRADLPVDANS
jgi:nitroimidazol reductase NimA-like FMN-containing flavoprotein (pyridoxamine 5'-phosphate oxidase superfamily)